VVINCLGLLQDIPGESASDIHEHFVTRLLAALRDVGRPAARAFVDSGRCRR